MRTLLVFTIILTTLVACSNNNSPEKRYQIGPWNGLFGTRMGITKEQVERYTALAEVGNDGQSFAGRGLPVSYGYQFESIVYTINSVEGLCALSVVSSSDEDTRQIRHQIEELYGKPTIERPNKYVTWDKNNMDPAAVIVINYAPYNNIIKVFYPNADRCRLL